MSIKSHNAITALSAVLFAPIVSACSSAAPPAAPAPRESLASEEAAIVAEGDVLAKDCDTTNIGAPCSDSVNDIAKGMVCGYAGGGGTTVGCGVGYGRNAAVGDYAWHRAKEHAADSSTSPPAETAPEIST